MTADKGHAPFYICQICGGVHYGRDHAVHQDEWMSFRIETLENWERDYRDPVYVNHAPLSWYREYLKHKPETVK